MVRLSLIDKCSILSKFVKLNSESVWTMVMRGYMPSSMPMMNCDNSFDLNTTFAEYCGALPNFVGLKCNKTLIFSD